MTHAGASLAPPRATRLIHVLFAIQLVSMGAMEMSGPFWPLRLKALSTSNLEFGFAGVAVYVGPMLGIMLTSALWGRIGDRTGHKLMMIRALLGLALTQLALAWASDVWAILALRFVQGACAGYIAPAQTYGVGIVSPSRRARLFAYLQVSTNLGSLTGAVVGGLILDNATFFWINFVAGLRRRDRPAGRARTAARADRFSRTDAGGRGGGWRRISLARISNTGPARHRGHSARESDDHADTVLALCELDIQGRQLGRRPVLRHAVVRIRRFRRPVGPLLRESDAQ